MAVQASATGEAVRRSSGYEYRSRLKVGSLPLVHIVRGVDPSTGTRPPAIGGIAVGQAAIGLGWGIGQIATGVLAAGQVAAGAVGSIGQVALGAQPLGLIEQTG